MSPRGAPRDEGQATVELALTLPLIAVLLAALVQTGFVVLDQVRLWHAAREAARAAVVDAAPHVPRLAVREAGFDDAEIVVVPEPAVRRRGDPLTVSLDYRPHARVPLIGVLFGGLRLEASATMRIERP